MKGVDVEKTGLGFESSLPQMPSSDCHWEAYDLDDVAWDVLRRATRVVDHDSPGTCEGTFATIVGADGRAWDLTMYRRLLGKADYRGSLTRLLTLSDVQLRLVAHVQAAWFAATRGGRLIPLSWPTRQEIAEAAAWPDDDVYVLPPPLADRVPVPLVSDPASCSNFVDFARSIGWYDDRPSPPAYGLIALVGQVVDGHQRRQVEALLEMPLVCLPRQRSQFYGDDPFRVLRAVVDTAGDRRAQLSSAIRDELSTGTAASLAALTAPQGGGELDDIRTLWSIYGTPGTYEERALAWWAWLADALDGTVAIPEEIFWDGPRDPLTLDEVLNP